MEITKESLIRLRDFYMSTEDDSWTIFSQKDPYGKMCAIGQARKENAPEEFFYIPTFLHCGIKAAPKDSTIIYLNEWFRARLGFWLVDFNNKEEVARNTLTDMKANFESPKHRSIAALDFAIKTWEEPDGSPILDLRKRLDEKRDSQQPAAMSV